MASSGTEVALRVFLHGWGSCAEQFRAAWPPARLQPVARCCFLNGCEQDPLTGRRRWFAFSGQEATLARSLRERSEQVERMIECELLHRGEAADAVIALVGHSQGGMLALAITLRGRLNVAAADSYAAFLPAAEQTEASAGATAARITLHASQVDEYVPLHRVQATVQQLRRLGLRHVELRVGAALPHAFCADWLDRWPAPASLHA